MVKLAKVAEAKPYHKLSIYISKVQTPAVRAPSPDNASLANIFSLTLANRFVQCLRFRFKAI